ncbi:hypothetical protein [Floridanema aerugineum]|uniref:ATPase dynein-related AAA domain-containing protein n=1 Tax=Floridaenema aerugineum BLCC-F46 TaxID=3153654 RepID=A0ABV4X9K1_9CYAN
MARKNKFSTRVNQPLQPSAKVPETPIKTDGTVSTTQNSSAIIPQSQEIQKLQEKINELGFQLEVQKEESKAKEAEIIKREQELAVKEAQAINGFKDLEASARQEWAIQKEREIEAERERIVKTAEQEAEKILNTANTQAERIVKDAQKFEANAQNKADKIIEEAQNLANEHRQRAREQTIQEIQNRESELELRRKEFDAKQQSIEAKEENIRKLKRDLERKEEDLEDENNWLTEQKKKLQQKERSLAERESNYSEEAVNHLIAEKTGIQQQLDVIQEENYRLRKELDQSKTILQAAPGSPERLSQENARLETKLQEYEQILDQYPSEAELAELRRRAEAAIDFEAMYRDLQARVDDLERIRRLQQIERVETESLRKERDTLKLLNEYLKEQIEDLERMLGNLKDKKIQAFGNFAEMDSKTDNATDNINRVTVNKFNDLARQTRAWMANLPTREELEKGKAESTLFAHYYDQHTIQAFIASMVSSRLIIIQGVSGTGKTSLPEYFSYAVGGKFARIEVQSSWRDKLDLVGSYNSFFRIFNESPFSRALYEAGTERYRNYPYFIVLDEMNLSRVEYYFADFLSIMEGRLEDREVELLNHDPTSGQLPKGLKLKNGAVKLPIPDNVWFIGTANTDESTYEITRKVYDRAQVLQIDEPFQQENLRPTEAANLSILDFYNAKQKAIESFPNTDGEAAKGCIEEIGLALHEYFQVGYGQRLLDQLFIFLPTYRATGGSLGKGLDHFIARKLLWQIQNRTDPNVRSGLQEVKDTIEQSFAKTRLGNASISLKLLDGEINKFKR